MKYPNVTLGRIEAVWNKLGGEEGVRRFLAGTVEIVFKTILSVVRTVRSSAQSQITTSKGYFEGAGIVWMGHNFEDQFIGLKVPEVTETELTLRKLEKSSVDGPILEELGDEAKIAVSQFVAFLAENRGSANWFLAYLEGKDGVLWAVGAYWFDDGWFVEALSVEDPVARDVGGVVVSR